MPGLTKAMPRHIGAVAAAVLIASGELASGEPLATQNSSRSASFVAVATLGSAPMQAAAREPDLPANRVAPLREASPPDTISGIASFYEAPGETASGEPYDPMAYTAAAQLDIRDRFGGIKFGRLYQPSYALAEYAGKKLILKFNDVGPLPPGRKFDLSRAAMQYFDGIEKGLLPDFKVTVLPPGRVYTPGPVPDDELAAMGRATVDSRLASGETASAPRTSAEQGAAASSLTSVETAQVRSTDLPVWASFDCEDMTFAGMPPRSFLSAWQGIMQGGGWVDETEAIEGEPDREDEAGNRRWFDDDGHHVQVACGKGAC